MCRMQFIHAGMKFWTILLFKSDLSNNKTRGKIVMPGAKGNGQAGEADGVSTVWLGDGGVPCLQQFAEAGLSREIVRTGCWARHLHPTDTHRSRSEQRQDLQEYPARYFPGTSLVHRFEFVVIGVRRVRWVNEDTEKKCSGNVSNAITRGDNGIYISALVSPHVTHRCAFLGDHWHSKRMISQVETF